MIRTTGYLTRVSFQHGVQSLTQQPQQPSLLLETGQALTPQRYLVSLWRPLRTLRD
jgi:hypothetical protein